MFVQRVFIFIFGNRNFLDVLRCVGEFLYYKADDRIAFVVFSILSEILSAFPAMVDSIYDFLLHTILSHPKFLVKVITLLNKLSNVALVHKILVNFDGVLVSLSPLKMQNYLPLAQRVVMECNIDPNV